MIVHRFSRHRQFILTQGDSRVLVENSGNYVPTAPTGLGDCNARLLDRLAEARIVRPIGIVGTQPDDPPPFLLQPSGDRDWRRRVALSVAKDLFRG